MIAESYERIHRSNLVGMGVVPLQFFEGDRLRASGSRAARSSTSRGSGCSAPGSDGHRDRQGRHERRRFQAIVRIDTPKEQEYFIHGGILQYVLRQLASGKQAA